jgi:hypothetical protein
MTKQDVEKYCVYPSPLKGGESYLSQLNAAGVREYVLAPTIPKIGVSLMKMVSYV